MQDRPALPAISARIWDMKYRLKDASGVPIDDDMAATFARVANAVAQAEPDAHRAIWAARFETMLNEGLFLPAGRILAGAGANRSVTLFNCFVMGRIEDDMASIFDNLKQAALTLQQGGGIGHDFSTLRPRGALVKGVGAEASGPVSFMDVWDAMCRTIMSAGMRRGAMMATLRCDHPDIEAFVAAKSDPARLRNFNLSVLVTDAFMEAVRSDADWDLVFEGKRYRTLPARDLWDRILRATYDYAEPGVIFIDRVNALNNLQYAEEISATNPCVTAETWIQTSQGPRQVAELIGRPFEARLNGVCYPSGPEGFFETGPKPVISLTTDDGRCLTLTSDHLVQAVKNFSRYDMSVVWRAAGSLSPGDLVVLNDHRAAPSWPGDYDQHEGYLLGLLVGDGTLKSDKAILSVWKPAMEVNGRTASGVDGVMNAALEAARRLPHRSDFSGWIPVSGRNEFRLALSALRRFAIEVGMSPGNKAITTAMERGSSDFTIGFLRGLFDSDGSVQGSQEKGVSVRLAQSDLHRLEAVQRMLLRLGINASIYLDRRTAGQRALPDGRGGAKLYVVRAQHELVIAGENLRRFADTIDFCDTDKASRLTALLGAYRRRLNRERFVARVSNVRPAGTVTVYDTQIPGANAFDADGFVVHNCGEQPLPPHGACLLGSINLARLVTDPFTEHARLDEERLAETSALAVRFLDDVIDISRFPLPEQAAEARAKRRIGLGLTGLADALAMLGARYGSDEAQDLGGRWMDCVKQAAYGASAQLAKDKGAFPLFDAEHYLANPNLDWIDGDLRASIATHGIRNALLTSIAPTGTISLFAGNVSSGVEPIFDLSFRRRILDGDGAREEIVEDEAYRRFRDFFGPDAPLPDGFVTVNDLQPEDHLAMQAALQRHVDSAISKTVNCPADIPFETFRSLYDRAYDLGLKGCTTYRPNAITGAVLSAATPPEAQTALPLEAPRSFDPHPRETALPGFTYKLRWPDSGHAIYVTINDAVLGGRRVPFEIFINSKNLEHYAWTVALTRMISAVFRRGGDVSFVVEELKAVFDPRGGQWMDGRYVPSLLAAIGDIIGKHMVAIGALSAEDAAAAFPAAERCPRCGQGPLVPQEGCLTCRDCGYSRCS